MAKNEIVSYKQKEGYCYNYKVQHSEKIET